MNGFENNIFSMVNSMMNQPEFEKMAKHFENQMQEQMQKYKESQSSKNGENSKNGETSKNTESSSPKTDSSTPKTTESSTPKTTESSTPKTTNSNKTPCAARMGCPLMFGPRMFEAELKSALNSNKTANSKQATSKQATSKQPTSVSIPLKRFNPENVEINLNKNGLVTVTASRENTEESNRNGQRKTTIMIEETCQLPGYLVDNGLLGSVQSKFHNGFLVLSFPEDPKLVAEREAEERKNSPIEIPILMED